MDTKRCTKCGQSKPLDQYYKSTKVKSGLQSLCKACYMRTYRPNKHPVAVTEKRCKACGEIKPASEYWKHGGVKDGLQPRCKACVKEYLRERYRNDAEYRERTKTKAREMYGARKRVKRNT